MVIITYNCLRAEPEGLLVLLHLPVLLDLDLEQLLRRALGRLVIQSGRFGLALPCAIFRTFRCVGRLLDGDRPRDADAAGDGSVDDVGAASCSHTGLHVFGCTFIGYD